jgi:cytoplasmic iron level regulating protein YaaA (DUF328/UPF0246 family)
VKIVISPAKTQEIKKHHLLSDKTPIYLNEHLKLQKILRSKSKKYLKQMYKLKDDKFEEVYQNIHHYDLLNEGHAFVSYNGLVFKQLDMESYNEDDFDYIKNHVRILDAMYGILEPGTLIKPYRLDMKMNLKINLYDYFPINQLLRDDIIINLASDEFSKMITLEMVTIHFREYKDGTYKNMATYSKQARGMFLDYMIKQKCTSIDQMKLFQENGYCYNHDLSDKRNIFFTRNA